MARGGCVQDVWPHPFLQREKASFTQVYPVQDGRVSNGAYPFSPLSHTTPGSVPDCLALLHIPGNIHLFHFPEAGNPADDLLEIQEEADEMC